MKTILFVILAMASAGALAKESADEARLTNDQRAVNQQRPEDSVQYDFTFEVEQIRQITRVCREGRRPSNQSEADCKAIAQQVAGLCTEKTRALFLNQDRAIDRSQNEQYRAAYADCVADEKAVADAR